LLAHRAFYTIFQHPQSMHIHLKVHNSWKRPLCFDQHLLVRIDCIRPIGRVYSCTDINLMASLASPASNASICAAMMSSCKLSLLTHGGMYVCGAVPQKHVEAIAANPSPPFVCRFH
jgi:hypothetical protein